MEKWSKEGIVSPLFYLLQSLYKKMIIGDDD